MTIRPIDLQVVVAQQTSVSGTEQSQQNTASQIQAQDMQKIPDKTHERETQVGNPGESDPVKVKEKGAEEKKKGSGGKKKEQDSEEEKDEKKEPHVQEDGKGVRLDVTT